MLLLWLLCVNKEKRKGRKEKSARMGLDYILREWEMLCHWQCPFSFSSAGQVHHHQASLNWFLAHHRCCP